MNQYIPVKNLRSIENKPTVGDPKFLRVAIGSKQFGHEEQISVPIKNGGMLRFNIDGRPEVVSMFGLESTFSLLPYQTAAGSAGHDPLVCATNQSTSAMDTAPARKTNGAIRCAATTAANLTGMDNTAWSFGTGGAAATATIAPGARFGTRVSFPTLVTATGYFVAGMDTEYSKSAPVPTNGAGAEGFGFLADPANVLTATTGATATQAKNWLAWQKIGTATNSTRLFFDTGVPIAASTSYELTVEIDGSFIPHFFVNNVEVSLTCTNASPLTSGSTVTKQYFNYKITGVVSSDYVKYGTQTYNNGDIVVGDAVNYMTMYGNATVNYAPSPFNNPGTGGTATTTLKLGIGQLTGTTDTGFDIWYVRFDPVVG